MTARDYALLELDRKHLPGWPPNLIRARGPRPQPPSDPRDRALAEQLIIGVIKNHLRLQFLASHYAQRALKSIDPLAQKILSIALYQIAFLTRIPPSAAVNEAVNQAKRFGRTRAAGFINAVLRKATTQPAPPMPDPIASPAEYAEIVLSHPRDLFAHLSALLPSADALRLCEHNNAEPPTIVRLFRGASESDLHSPGIQIQPHESPGFFVVSPAPVPLLADWAQRGIAQAQDPTAGAIIPHLQLEPGQKFLDRCAGLGTKTLQAQELIGPNGAIVAVDPSEPRCRLLQNLLRERSITNIAVRQIGMLTDLPPEDPRSFDRILIDVPCSNSGVLARRPEARYAQGVGALQSLVQLQDRILDDTAAHLAPGGRMVYSTCSLWPEENQRRVAAFLSRHSDYRLLEEHSTFPGLDPEPRRYHDGGYFAVLARQ